MKATLKQIRESGQLDHQFREMCLYYAAILGEEGVRVRPYISPELPIFSKLPENEKKSAISLISSILEVCEEVRGEGWSLRDNRRLIWRALSKLGWTPGSDIFGLMEDGDVICFHDANQRLIFQNLNFFTWVSYTLEDFTAGFGTRARSGGMSLLNVFIKTFMTPSQA